MYRQNAIVVSASRTCLSPFTDNNFDLKTIHVHKGHSRRKTIYVKREAGIGWYYARFSVIIRHMNSMGNVQKLGIWVPYALSAIDKNHLATENHQLACWGLSPVTKNGTFMSTSCNKQATQQVKTGLHRHCEEGIASLRRSSTSELDIWL